MLAFDRILLPTDFSEIAHQALPYAAHLADQHDAVLHILHVSARDGTGAPPDDETPSSQRQLVECARQAAEALGLSPTTHHPTLVREMRETDSVREAVVEYAEEEDVDLIVLGTARGDDLRTLLPRSRASEIVRHASCPVFTVFDEPEAVPRPVDRIFVPYDFSDHANRAVQYAEDLGTLYEADVTLVHVIEDLAVPPEYEVQVPDLNVRSVRSRAKAALQGVANDDHRVLVATGHPAQRVVEIADDRNADLLVLATHGRTGLRRMLLGSVAEQVLRQAPCPVFTVKAFERSPFARQADEA